MCFAVVFIDFVIFLVKWLGLECNKVIILSKFWLLIIGIFNVEWMM